MRFFLHHTRARSTRGQITSFIVVGLVLLGVVGILFSLSDSLQQESVQKPLTSDERFRYDAATKIIRDCVQAGLQRAVLTIASQGGAYYSGSARTGVDSPDLGLQVTSGGQTSLVVPGIVRDVPESIGIPTTPSRAPGVKREFIRDPTEAGSPASVLGGAVVLPRLCDAQGPNKARDNSVAYTCEFDAYGLESNRNTIQNKLQRAVQDQTIACVQQSEEVLAQIGDVQTFFSRQPTIIYGDRDIAVSYSFDTNVSLQKSNFSYSNVTITLPIQLKRLYNFVRKTLREDTLNVQFDKVAGYRLVTGCSSPDGIGTCWQEGFELEVVRNAVVSQGSHYDLLIFRDRNSSIAGRPLEWRTLAENRRPILASLYDLSSFPEVTTHPYDYPSDSGVEWFLKYDKYAHYMDSIFFEPSAYDYDEDQLVFTYSGWKGSEEIDFNIGSSLTGNGGCYEWNTDGTPIKCNYWNEDYFIQSSPYPIPDNLWQLSAPYVSGEGCDGLIRRCASVTLRASGDDVGMDMGPHRVRITASDDGDLYDYADVAILVGTD